MSDSFGELTVYTLQAKKVPYKGGYSIVVPYEEDGMLCSARYEINQIIKVDENRRVTEVILYAIDPRFEERIASKKQEEIDRLKDELKRLRNLLKSIAIAEKEL